MDIVCVGVPWVLVLCTLEVLRPPWLPPPPLLPHRCTCERVLSSNEASSTDPQPNMVQYIRTHTHTHTVNVLSQCVCYVYWGALYIMKHRLCGGGFHLGKAHFMAISLLFISAVRPPRRKQWCVRLVFFPVCKPLAASLLTVLEVWS